VKPVRLTRHAQTVAEQRGIQVSWIEDVLRTPDWTEPDKAEPDAVRFFGRPAQPGQHRLLRVVCVESDAELRVVTVFFDRDAKRPA
jgi:hypothetical protein